jgi:hypothetical protein
VARSLYRLLYRRFGPRSSGSERSLVYKNDKNESPEYPYRSHTRLRKLATFASLVPDLRACPQHTIF